MHLRTRAVLGLSLLATAACGSAPPPKVEPPKSEEPASRPSGPTPQVSQELGSIEQRADEQMFNRLQNAFEKCHSDGRERVEYLTGDVKVFMRVGQDGKVRYSYFEETSRRNILGDDGSCCHHRAFPNSHPIGDHSSGPQPDIVFDHDPLGSDTLVYERPLRIVKHVIDSHDLGKR